MQVVLEKQILQIVVLMILESSGLMSVIWNITALK